MANKYISKINIKAEAYDIKDRFAWALIAPAYSTGSIYAEGQYVIYDADSDDPKLYRAKQIISSPGAFDPTKWDLIGSVANEFYTNLSSTTPLASAATGSAGTSLKVSRADHVHPKGPATNADTATALANFRAIDGVNFNGVNDIVHYGVCNSAGNSQIKSVTCTGFKINGTSPNYSYVNGARIAVKFVNANATGNQSIQLNVNNGTITGPNKFVYYRGHSITETPAAVTGDLPTPIPAGSVLEFVYDSTDDRFNLVGPSGFNIGDIYGVGDDGVLPISMGGTGNSSFGAGKVVVTNDKPADYSQTSTYQVGDYCTQNDVAYRCITAITSGEAFNSSKWEQVSADADDAFMFTESTITSTELGYLSGATSNIQAQINAITGGGTGIDHVRFVNQDWITPNPTSSTYNSVIIANIVGGKSLAKDDLVVFRTGNIAEITADIPSGATSVSAYYRGILRYVDAYMDTTDTEMLVITDYLTRS